MKSRYELVGGGLNMYYEIRGRGGAPLVLIHGRGSTIETTFGNALRYFSKDRLLIAVELQGHGHTADVNRPFSFEQDAKPGSKTPEWTAGMIMEFLGE